LMKCLIDVFGWCETGPVFLLDPDDAEGTEKPGEVIRGSAGLNSPIGVQGQSPWWGVRRAKPPETGVWELNRF